MLVDFEELLRRISDVQRSLSITSLYGLSRMTGAEIQLFQEIWPSIAVKRRRRIIQTMVEIAEISVEADFSAIFRFCLTDEDEEVRAQAIEGLWEDEDVRLIGPLVRLLRDDPSPRVRAEAATSLGRFVLLGELEEIEATLALMVQDALLRTIYTHHEDLEVWRRAVESIAYSSGAEVVDIIEAAYNHNEEKMRVSAVFAMGRSADTRWREVVKAELKSPNSEMRYEAARACGELEDVNAVPLLIHLINDPDREVQEMAIWALGCIGGEEARRVLQEIYNGEDEGLSEAAAEALEELEFLSGSLDYPLHELIDDFSDES